MNTVNITQDPFLFIVSWGKPLCVVMTTPSSHVNNKTSALVLCSTSNRQEFIIPSLNV